MIKFKKICWHHWEHVVVQIGPGTIVGKECKKCGKMSKKLEDVKNHLNKNHEDTH